MSIAILVPILSAIGGALLGAYATHRFQISRRQEKFSVQAARYFIRQHDVISSARSHMSNQESNDEAVSDIVEAGNTLDLLSNMYQGDLVDKDMFEELEMPDAFAQFKYEVDEYLEATDRSEVEDVARTWSSLQILAEERRNR